MEQALAFDYNRRFGVEIELNSSDGRDFKEHPLGDRELPQGIEYVGHILSEILDAQVEIQAWSHTHNNNVWVLKPDSSCGIELCSPVYKRWHGLKSICKAIDLLGADPQIKIDRRCALHVHVEVADLSSREVSRILGHWVKCEPVFLDSVADYRKETQYCPCMGMLDFFHSDDSMSIDPSHIIEVMGSQKYFTANIYHMNKGRRKTIEFRIIGDEGCRNSYLTMNWIRFLVHFVEMTRSRRLFKYEQNNPWSSLCWLDPMAVIVLLGFDGGYELSPALEQTRAWFLSRLKVNVECNRRGMWSPEVRHESIREVNQLIDKFQIDPSEHLVCRDGSRTYSETYKC